MPRPIKETPILYDEDAYRFEMAAHNVMPLPVEEQEEMDRIAQEEADRAWLAYLAEQKAQQEEAEQAAQVERATDLDRPDQLGRPDLVGSALLGCCGV